MADLSHELSKIHFEFNCPWSQHIILLPFQIHGHCVELSGQNLNALNVRFSKRFKVLEHCDYLCDLQKIMLIVTWQGLVVRVGIKFKKLHWTLDCTFSSCLQKLSNLQKICISETSKDLFPGLSIVCVFALWKRDWYSWYKQIQSCQRQNINGNSYMLMSTCVILKPQKWYHRFI